MHCNALQCTATHCNALQRTAMHCAAAFSLEFILFEVSWVMHRPRPDSLLHFDFKSIYQVVQEELQGNVNTKIASSIKTRMSWVHRRNRYMLLNSKCRRDGQFNASTRRLLPEAMFERWPQVCCIKITFELLPNNWFVSTKMNSIRSL